MERQIDIPVGTTSRAARLRMARRKVAALKGFYVHAAVFTGVMVLLAVIDLATGRPYWAHWVLLGWGAGLLAHRILLGAGISERVRRWEARKVDEYMKTDDRF